jgi:prevent-host-death family protein
MGKPIVVGIHEAKTQFSKLVKQAEAGEEVVVQNHGKPVAKIIAYPAKQAARKPGQLAGKIVIKPGFDDPLPEFAELFDY